MKFKTLLGTLGIFIVMFNITTKPVLAEEEIVKGKVEQAEVIEETEYRFKEKIKVRITEGNYTGTSMFTDYEGDIRIKEKDEIFIRQIVEENELRKIEFVGLSRSTYILWLGIIAIVILITIAGTKAISKLGPTILIAAILLFNLFQIFINSLGSYLGVILLVSIILVVSNVLRKGANKFTLIATLGGMAGILLTALLQIAFADAMRLPIASQELVNSGVFIAASGIIASNALQIAFGIKENLERQVEVARTEILNEGVTISRTISSAGINILLFCFVGLSFATIITSMQNDQPTGLFNNPQIAHISVSILASAIGVLIVPIVTTILTFFIIDVNNLGRRIPKRKQLSMEM